MHTQDVKDIKGLGHTAVSSCPLQLSATVLSCLLSTALLVSITMAAITGSFKLVSTSNMAAAFAVMGSQPNIVPMFLFL